MKTLCLISMLALFTQFAWPQTVEVSPAVSNVTAGGTAFDVTVQLSGASNLQASHVEFTFDNTLVRYNGVTRGSVMNGTDDVFRAAPPAGPTVNKVTVDQAVIGATPWSGSGSLFTISFIPLKGGTSAVDLTVTLRDPLNNAITATVNDGQVSVSNPAPTLASILPTSKTVGDAGFTLTVNGTNFVDGVSVVKLDGGSRTTTFVSSTQLTAAIPAADLLAAGSRSITVVNPLPGGGTSGAQTLTVNKGSTTTAVGSSDNPSDSSASVTFTATVTPSAATGSVEFFDGATSLGTRTLSGGAATLATATLAPGTHTIKAVYAGDDNYLTSENTTSQQVDPVIMASAGPNGSISPAGQRVVSLGGSLNFNILPDPHHHVADVLVDGVSVGAVTTYNFTTVTRNHTISATFALDTYTLNVTAVNGTVAKSPDKSVYNWGESVQLTATPASHYHFANWSGDAGGTMNPLTFVVDGNKNITANFAIDTYPITASAGSGGTVTPDGITNVNYGGSQLYSIAPATGYHIVDVLVDLVSQGAITSYNFPNVTAPHTISATFAINTYTLTVNTAGSGSVTKNPATGPYDHGSVVRLTATADPGYTFTGWSGDVNSGTNPLDVTMDGNKTITATFSQNAYTVSVSGTNGTVAKNPDKTNYAFGESVTLTATPSAGYHFVNWSGDATGTDNPLQITVNGNKSITAHFAINTYTLTTGVVGSGSVAKAPDQATYDHGTSVQLTATPAPGYTFTGWSGDATGTDNPLSVTMNGNKNITATFTVNSYTLTINTVGSGSVAKIPDQSTYNHGTTVQLTATASPGYTFTGWSGGATGTTNPVNVTMDGNKTVTATFTANAYTITINSANGTVIKSPDKATYGYGENVQLTANPSTGYTFTSWSGDATGTTNPVTITVNGNKTVTANYTLNSYALTVSTVGSGTVAKNPDQASYNHGSTVQLTATPGTGYDFTGWSGALTGTTNPANILMDAAKSVTATFTIKSYTITVTAGLHGTITPPGPTTVNHGGNQLYTIAPASGYHIVDVKVDNVSQGVITSYQFTNVTSNRSIEATFAINSYTITVSTGAHGTVVPSGPSVAVNHGDNQLFTMSPEPGYHVASLTIDGVRVNPAATHTFVGVTGNRSIGVTFALDSYLITGPTEYNLDVDGNGAIDMKVNLAAKPAGDATIGAIAYVTAPAGQPNLPPDGLPFYLVVNSTLPDNAFAATVRLDCNGLAGFGPESALAYYNSVTSSWILVDGTYLASDPLFSGHPSFTFQTDHFTPYVFFTPPIPPVHLYGSSSSSVAAPGMVFANNSWRPAGPSYGGSDDWSWSGAQTVSVYLVPEPGAHFGSADITLAWDVTQMTLAGTDFGSVPNGLYGAGQAYSPSTTVTTPYGPGKVRIQCTRGDGGNFSTILGNYIARVDFTLLKPGHSPVAIIGADFQILQGIQKPYMIPMQAEVKAYLGDITAAGNLNTGDGKVDFEDLVSWSYSYWAGVPGYTGGAPYKVKYDFGPTADNYIFSLPQPDGKIDFEDLLIFSIGYGQSAGKYLPKAAVESAQPVEISLGSPVASGNEVKIPVVLGGNVTDVRGLKVEINGQFGSFLGAEQGELLKGYSSPVPLLHRADGRSVHLDLAVMGLDASAIDRAGEVAVLRFAGTPRVQLTAFEARSSRNSPVAMKKVRGAGETEPMEFALLQNYPNPFNPSTTIEYQLPSQAMTDIEIYNMLGERVATLVHEVQPAGFYTVKWNGTNDSGAKVATGVYFYRMHAQDFTTVKKMLLVK